MKFNGRKCRSGWHCIYRRAHTHQRHQRHTPKSQCWEVSRQRDTNIEKYFPLNGTREKWEEEEVEKKQTQWMKSKTSNMYWWCVVVYRKCGRRTEPNDNGADNCNSAHTWAIKHGPPIERFCKALCTANTKIQILFFGLMLQCILFACTGTQALICRIELEWKERGDYFGQPIRCSCGSTFVRPFISIPVALGPLCTHTERDRERERSRARFAIDAILARRPLPSLNPAHIMHWNW